MFLSPSAPFAGALWRECRTGAAALHRCGAYWPGMEGSFTIQKQALTPTKVRFKADLTIPITPRDVLRGR